MRNTERTEPHPRMSEGTSGTPPPGRPPPVGTHARSHRVERPADGSAPAVRCWPGSRRPASRRSTGPRAPSCPGRWHERAHGVERRHGSGARPCLRRGELAAGRSLGAPGGEARRAPGSTSSCSSLRSARSRRSSRRSGGPATPGTGRRALGAVAVRSARLHWGRDGRRRRGRRDGCPLGVEDTGAAGGDEGRRRRRDRGVGAEGGRGGGGGDGDSDGDACARGCGVVAPADT